LDAEPLDLIAAKKVGVRPFRREPNAVKQWPKLTYTGPSACQGERLR
jgi:hypothetical protein